MLPAFTVIYLALSFFVVKALELTSVWKPPGWLVLTVVAAGYFGLIGLWWLLKLTVDPFLDGGLSEAARNADTAMQYGGFKQLETSYLIVFGLCLAVSLIMGIWDVWVWTVGGAAILCFLYCLVRKGRDLIPQPALPTPLPPVQPAVPAKPGEEVVPAPSGDTVPHQFTWTYWTEPLVGRAVQVSATVQLSQSEYDERHAEPRVPRVAEWGAYVSQGRGPTLDSLSDELRRYSTQHRLSSLHEVALALSFAQGAISYAPDEESTRQPEYPKYPVETVHDENGDCEDKSILAAAALKQLGYDVLLFNLPHHIALGVAFEDIPGDYEVFNAKRYYCCEATAEGSWIGYRPKWWRAKPDPIPIP